MRKSMDQKADADAIVEKTHGVKDKSGRNILYVHNEIPA